MIEPGLPPKAPTVDSSSHSSASKGHRSEGGSGFSETLSTVDQKSQKASSSHDGSQNGGVDDDAVLSEGEGEAAGEETTTAAPRNSTKPVIDIRYGVRANPDQNLTTKGLQDAAAQAARGAGTKGAADSAAGGQGQDTAGVGKSKKGADLLSASGAAANSAANTDSTSSEAAAGQSDEPAAANENGDGSAVAIDRLDEVLIMLAGGSGEAAAAMAGQLRAAGGQGADRNSLAAGNDARTTEGLAIKVDGQSGFDASASGEAGSAEASGERSFRFVRADGKGQPLALRIGAGSNAEARYESANAAQEGSQTVTVLDSRRYIAPASNSNISSIAAAMTGDGEWVSAMQPGSELANAASQSSAGKVVNTLKIQMSPIELGNVTATMRIAGDALTVHLTVESSAAYKRMSEDQDGLLKALRSQGYAVDQIQISMASVDKSAASDGGQSAAQQQGQQAAQDGSRQSSAGGSRDGAPSGNGGGNYNSGKTTDDTTAAANSGSDNTGGAGGSRPGSVYI